jgi:hypothetical protein
VTRVDAARGAAHSDQGRLAARQRHQRLVELESVSASDSPRTLMLEPLFIKNRGTDGQMLILHLNALDNRASVVEAQVGQVDGRKER